MGPEAESFFYPEYGPQAENTGGERHLQRCLTRAVQQKELKRIVASAHGAEKFILQVTSPTTAGDIFFVNYANRRNRLMGNEFLLIGRLFLDLPVCCAHCTVDNCGGLDIHQDGQHATQHAKSRVVQRHDGVSRAIGSFFRHLARSELSPYSCNYEVELDSVESVHHRPGKTQNLRCDFELVHERRTTGSGRCAHHAARSN